MVLYSAFKWIQTTVSGLFRPVERQYHVRALLGASSMSEHCPMVVDFMALHELLRPQSQDLEWFCNFSIKYTLESGSSLMDNPAFGGILTEAPAFETSLSCRDKLVEMEETEFYMSLLSAASKLPADDVLVIALIGVNVPSEGAFEILPGDPDLRCGAENVEECVREAKCTVVLINTACDPEFWKSPRWTLVTTADSLSGTSPKDNAGQEGVFAKALRAKHVYENACHTSSSHDCGIPGGFASAHNNGFRLDEDGKQGIAGYPTCALTNIFSRFGGCRDTSGSRFPLTGLDSCSLSSFAALSHPGRLLCCISPSQRTKMYPSPPPSPPSYIPLTRAEEDELLKLCKQYRLTEKNVSWSASEEDVSMYSDMYNQSKLPDPYKDDLFRTLRDRARQNDRAFGIAVALGWTDGADKLGRPIVLARADISQTEMLELCEQAEESGCCVSILKTRRKYDTAWLQAAYWLAKVWDMSGKPLLAHEDWGRAALM
ncbi:hypothetical protein SCP_0505800 [Sparassis crispa]|uniref:Uncharacterized protein n=1 Tax=Sparassis crispa TaxID=139825 RepID=A0A401GMU2_9APHY|nr:hypothetical protein SCP_0505800 [Sparassis crispa]GBE83526.1 hypothetical protein SCP_0505800 [Sparassis crispa]